MASPQKENGFTSIANEILDEIAKRRLNGTQFRIIMVVWRYTYGFQRKSHAFSLNFLVDKTGMSKDSIKRELKALVNKKVLRVITEANFNRPRELAFNKDHEEWKIKKNKTPQGDDLNTGGENDTSTGGKTSPSTGGENDTSTGGELAPYINKEKENNKERRKKRSRKSQIYDVDSIQYRLAKRLYDRILENNPNHKEPNLNKWADDVRLMMEIDKRTGEQIEYLIDWSQQDPFWKGNILSISKLREQFDRLVIQLKEKMNKQRNGPKKPRAYQSMEDWLEEEAQ